MPDTMTAVSVPADDVRRWEAASGRPFLMSVAMAWARYAPRYKGLVPRVIGRRFGRGMRTTVRTRSGGTIAVDSNNLDIYATMMLRGGVWEPHIQDACQAVVRPGDIVFDIGANAGIVAIDLAARMKGNLTVIAFEPIPSLARCLALSAALSGLGRAITVYEAMLGATEGEASLFIPSHAVYASVRARGRAVELKRPMHTLDALVGRGAIPPPDFIKIDVEGGELEVFRGATDVLRRRRPAIIFEADQNMTRFGSTRRELVGLLADCAPYRFYYVTEHGFLPAEDLDSPVDHEHSNMLALPPDRPTPSLGAPQPA